MSESIAYKLLGLLNPDAQSVRQRFTIEAPAFVSPFTSYGPCHICDVEIHPLLYQVGRTTVSVPHLPGCPRGIFCITNWRSPDMLRLLETNYHAKFLCTGLVRDEGRSFEPLNIGIHPHLRPCGDPNGPFRLQGGTAPLEQYLFLPIPWTSRYPPTPWVVEFRDGVPLFQRVAEGAAA